MYSKSLILGLFATLVTFTAAEPGDFPWTITLPPDCDPSKPGDAVEINCLIPGKGPPPWLTSLVPYFTASDAKFTRIKAAGVQNLDPSQVSVVTGDSAAAHWIASVTSTSLPSVSTVLTMETVTKKAVLSASATD